MDERTPGDVTAVRIGRGVLESTLDGTEPFVAILSQPGNASAIADLIDLEAGSSPTVVRRELPDGEAAKSLAVAEETISWLAESGALRDSVLVGVGGGALTDVVGFIGSIYMRGVRVRYVPTTLLGAVDAAIGGKTAVNVAGKNLAGTFSHPERVIIDLDVIDQVPIGVRREGMAEAYKAGLIGDPELAQAIQHAGLEVDLGVVVPRAVDVKIAIVEEDFRESGRRAHLNFGHTIGHAVETLSGWSHGASVSVGMVAACAISHEVTGYADAPLVTGTLEQLGLPVRAPTLDRTEVERLIGRDKKNVGAGSRMVLLEGVGRPAIHQIDAATLRTGLTAIGIS